MVHKTRRHIYDHLGYLESEGLIIGKYAELTKDRVSKDNWKFGSYWNFSLVSDNQIFVIETSK
jgi:hypothetical protein